MGFRAGQEADCQKREFQDLFNLAQFTGCLKNDLFFLQGNLNVLRFKISSFYKIPSLLQAGKQDFLWLRCQRGSMKAEPIIGHPVYQSQFSKSGIPSFWWPSSWLIISPNKMCLIPKSYLRPFLGAHRSLWWPLQLQNEPCKTPIPNAQSKRSPCISFLTCSVFIHT